MEYILLNNIFSSSTGDKNEKSYKCKKYKLAHNMFQTEKKKP